MLYIVIGVLFIHMYIYKHVLNIYILCSIYMSNKTYIYIYVIFKNMLHICYIYIYVIYIYTYRLYIYTYMLYIYTCFVLAYFHA